MRKRSKRPRPSADQPIRLESAATTPSIVTGAPASSVALRPPVTLSFARDTIRSSAACSPSIRTTSPAWSRRSGNGASRFLPRRMEVTTASPPANSSSSETGRFATAEVATTSASVT